MIKNVLYAAAVLTGILAFDYFLANYIAHYVPGPIASGSVHGARPFLNHHGQLSLPL
jgi:hypothetical protein